MKKIIIFFSCILLFVGTAFSQNSVVVSEQNIHNETMHSLIKEYRYPSTIACIMSEDNSSTFIYADQTMQTKEFTVPNIKVNDMLISLNGSDGRQDTVFFCGKDYRTGRATFGFFNVYDAYNSGGPVYLHDPFVSVDNAHFVEELTRMVLFADGTNIHYTCIGTDENSYPCLVEVIAGPAPSIWIYRTGTVASSPNDSPETMFDIKRVYSFPNDYLVTAGMDYEFGIYLNLRVYDLNDIFASSGIQETKHTFCIDTAFGIPWNKDDALLRPLKDNFFATVSYIDKTLYGNINHSISPNGLNSMHVGVFNISLLVSGSLSGMVTSAVFEPLNMTGNALTWLVNGPDNTMAFQEKILDASGYETSTFCELDFNATLDVSAVRKFNTKGDILYGLDAYNFPHNYVMSGFERDDRSILKFDMETFQSMKTCYTPEDYKFVYYNPYRSVARDKGFVVQSRGCNFNEIEVESVKVPLTIECEN